MAQKRKKGKGTTTTTVGAPKCGLSHAVVDTGSLCRSYTWQVADRTVLVDLLARIAAGEHFMLQRVIRGLKPKATSTPAHLSAIDSAIDQLVLSPAASDPDHWHRDGWLFQLMAWIAACGLAGKSDRIRAPHMIKAHKGFDGMILALDESASLRGLIISEEKATDDPRKMIRDRVWPEFEAHEKGLRLNEVIAEASYLLESVNPELAAQLAAKICWEKQRWFRVAVSTATDCADRKGLEALFKGYETTVTGVAERRRAEAFLLCPTVDLRDYMDKLANEVVARLKTLRLTATKGA